MRLYTGVITRAGISIGKTGMCQWGLFLGIIDLQTQLTRRIQTSGQHLVISTTFFQDNRPKRTHHDETGKAIKHLFISHKDTRHSSSAS